MDRFPEACVERTVEWVDTDASGHQHNSAILRWVEAAEAELFRTLELPDYFPSAPRVQQVINYKAKLWFGQRITATVKISALGTVTTVHVPNGAAAAQPWPEHLVRAVKGVPAAE